MALNFIPAEGTKLMTGFRAKEVFLWPEKIEGQKKKR